MDKDTIQELQNLESDKRLSQAILMSNQAKIAQELKGEMGQDMIDVLEGRKQVKLSTWDRIKHWINDKADQFLRAI